MEGEAETGLPLEVRAPGGRRSLSRSATRALDVLEHFGEARRPLRSVEIARALGLSASSASQLLKTMVDSAHLVFDAAAKSYFPSPRLAGFAGWMASSHGADQSLRARMQALQRRAGETVTLATPNGGFMLLLDRVGPAGAVETPERGLRVSMIGSALGTAYLATLPLAEVQRLAARMPVPDGDLPRLLDRVTRTRATQVADGPSPDGETWSLAAVLPPGAHPTPLVLGLAGPSPRVRPRLTALRQLLREVVAA